MGFLDKITKKVAGAMEKFSSKNMTGDSKAEYDKYAADKAKQASESKEADKIEGAYSKADLDNLSGLLKRVGAISESEDWIAGFSNTKHGQNAKAANLFTGKKNLRFLTKNGDTFYLLLFSDDKIKSYKSFTKENVLKVEVAGMITKAFKVTLKDNTSYSVDVSENKDKVSSMQGFLK